MANKKNLGKNTFYNTLKSVFSIIYPLITFPYISRILMAENVGKINFGNSIVSYFTLVASLGVSTYAIRECAIVRDDRNKLSKAASEIYSINIISTIVAHIGLVITLIFAHSLDNYRTLIIIQSTTILFTTLGADWINTAMEDFRYITIRTVVMQLVALVLMFIFVRQPEHYIIYAVICVFASSGANILNIFYRRKYCSISFTRHMNAKKHLPSIIVLFASMVAQTIYTNSDITMLGLMKGDYEVGLYSTAVKIYNLVNSICASITWVVVPQLAEGFAKKDYDRVNSLLSYAANFLIVLGLPCLVGINVITKSLIYLIAGEEYLPVAGALNILSVSLLFSFISGWMGNMIMTPAGRYNVSFRSSIVSALVNILLNFLMIPKWGIYAAACTTATAELLGIFMKIPYVDKEIHLIRPFEMLKAPVVGSLLIFVIGVFCNYFINSYYMIAIVTVVCGSIVYLLALLLMKDNFAFGLLDPIFSKLKGRLKK